MVKNFAEILCQRFIVKEQARITVERNSKLRPILTPDEHLLPVNNDALRVTVWLKADSTDF